METDFGKECCRSGYCRRNCTDYDYEEINFKKYFKFVIWVIQGIKKVFDPKLLLNPGKVFTLPEA